MLNRADALRMAYDLRDRWGWSAGRITGCFRVVLTQQQSLILAQYGIDLPPSDVWSLILQGPGAAPEQGILETGDLLLCIDVITAEIDIIRHP